jgi:hypothetical protein
MLTDEELQPGLLRGFDRRKLEIAGVIRSLRQIAEKNSPRNWNTEPTKSSYRGLSVFALRWCPGRQF